MAAKVIVQDDETGAGLVAVSVHQLDDGREVVTVEITTRRPAAQAAAPRSPFDELDELDAEIDSRQAQTQGAPRA